MVAGLVVVAVLLSPSAFDAGVSLAHGRKAEAQRNYVTAMRAYERVIAVYPDSIKALGRLLVTYYQNERLNEALAVAKKIGGRQSDDTGLIDDVNLFVERIERYYLPSTNLEPLLGELKSLPPKAAAVKLEAYVADHPEEAFSRLWLADMDFDLKKYDEVERLTARLTDDHSDLTPAWLLRGSAARERGDFVQAETWVRKAEELNHENPFVFTALARIELKRHRDVQGLKFAERALALNPEDPRVLATLALAYHYNSRFTERDAALAQVKAHPDLSPEVEFLDGIISGRLPWRD